MFLHLDNRRIELYSKILGFSVCVVLFGLYLRGLIKYLHAVTIRQALEWLPLWIMILLSFVLYGTAYLTRTVPVSRAKGWLETLFPFVVCALPLVPFFGKLFVVSLHLDTHSLVRWAISPPEGYAAGWGPLIAMSLGFGFMLVGVVYLRRSLSIMTEARRPVFTGIYRIIRHPLYTGETIYVAGLAWSDPCPLTVVFAALFIAGLQVRSRIEEKKLISVYPEYEEYRKRVGGFFPRLVRKHKAYQKNVP